MSSSLVVGSAPTRLLDADFRGIYRTPQHFGQFSCSNDVAGLVELLRCRFVREIPKNATIFQVEDECIDVNSMR